MFRRRFKNPYQASLSREMLLSEDWEELKTHRDARNKLAHLATLTLEEVQTIFK